MKIGQNTILSCDSWQSNLFFLTPNTSRIFDVYGFECFKFFTSYCTFLFDLEREVLCFEIVNLKNCDKRDQTYTFLITNNLLYHSWNPSSYIAFLFRPVLDKILNSKSDKLTCLCYYQEIWRMSCKLIEMLFIHQLSEIKITELSVKILVQWLWQN